tara:strand:+ start:265 stop:615 length:351 start_codon:yes stop_codon:yes gene_type:complete
MPIVKPGSDYDLHGCISSAGYLWCEILGRCLRTWEEACSYPTDCLGWYDGCNTCNLVDGKIGACTMMYCFTNNPPQCSVYAPGVPNIMPVIDYPHPIDPIYEPMPPVINPFIGGRL